MIKSIVLAAIAGAVVGTGASAATLTFGSGDWEYNEGASVPWLVTFDDATAGKWIVTVSANAGAGTDTGSILGFGFDTTLAGLDSGSFGFVSSSTGEGISHIDADTRDCGPGCNFNGALDKDSAFDWVLGFGAPGSSDGLLTDFSFTIDTDAALAADSVGRVGIRAQTVGSFPDGGNGSVKDINLTGNFDGGETPPAPIPLPAAGWMFAAGLAGLAGVARRRRV